MFSFFVCGVQARARARKSGLCLTKVNFCIQMFRVVETLFLKKRGKKTTHEKNKKKS